jgi:hypothetical protein
MTLFVHRWNESFQHVSPQQIEVFHPNGSEPGPRPAQESDRREIIADN